MKLKRNSVIIVVCLALLLAVIASGVVWYGKKEKTQALPKQQEIPVVEQEQVWYPIPELGIEIQLPKDIADDLVYKYKESPVTELVDGKEVPIKGAIRKSTLFSTKTLIGLDKENCSQEEFPGGIVTRMEGKQSDLEYKDSYANETVAVIRFDSFFVYYESSQSPCAFDQRVYDATYGVAQVFGSIFNPAGLGLNVEEWHSKVRELKK
ncbi:MAG: hypothetical protein IPJ67_02480 [Candidatus Moraniibacteriota bacterium]|nr:MAG: hypothetical protein IPJ67_02480 [Candidatus Moranbacteria bacterium]